MSETYEKFLERKKRLVEASGFGVSDLHPALFDFQRHIVELALRKGRFAVFSECGTGKTLMELEWARQVVEAIERWNELMGKR